MKKLFTYLFILAAYATVSTMDYQDAELAQAAFTLADAGR